MPAVPVSLPARSGNRLPAWVRDPPDAARITFWLLVAAVMIGLRTWVAVSLPTYGWTRDSGSYVAPVTAWLQSGQWVTNPRRGPVYSVFIAGIFKLGGTLKTVATAQAILGLLTGLLILCWARAWTARRAFWPLALCASFFALYGLPIELERLVRNETLLLLFATLSFGSWRWALRTGAARWFALSGLATGLMQLLKGIFPIFPLLVLALAAWEWRGRPARLVRLGGCYLVLFLLPLIASKLYDRLSATTRAPEPEAGEMFYGRTAQWTVLDGGIVPDVKARIHDEAAAYADRFQRTGKLDNNEIVKRSVVPSLHAILVDERHGSMADVNRLCWRLGIEAVAHHPFAYLRQVVHDLYLLNFITAQRFIVFLPHELDSSLRDAEAFVALHEKDTGDVDARVFDLPASSRAIADAGGRDSGLSWFSRFITATAKLRLLSPVFLTSLSLPLLVYHQRGRERLFWIGSGVLWSYYLLLLSTVGRPLDRYLMPVLPIMVWAISAASAVLWQRGVAWHAARRGGR